MFYIDLVNYFVQLFIDQVDVVQVVWVLVWCVVQCVAEEVEVCFVKGQWQVCCIVVDCVEDYVVLL